MVLSFAFPLRDIESYLYDGSTDDVNISCIQIVIFVLFTFDSVEMLFRLLA